MTKKQIHEELRKLWILRQDEMPSELKKDYEAIMKKVARDIT